MFVAKCHPCMMTQAFEERRRASLPKPILRERLELKIKDFVRDSIRRTHEKRGGGQ